MEKRCYKVKELQEMLGISRAAVYDLLKRKEFQWVVVMSGLTEAQLPERRIRSSNRQKVLDFCTLAVYDKYISGQ